MKPVIAFYILFSSTALTSAFTFRFIPINGLQIGFLSPRLDLVETKTSVITVYSDVTIVPTCYCTSSPLSVCSKRKKKGMSWWLEEPYLLHPDFIGLISPSQVSHYGKTESLNEPTQITYPQSNHLFLDAKHSLEKDGQDPIVAWFESTPSQSVMKDSLRGLKEEKNVEPSHQVFSAHSQGRVFPFGSTNSFIRTTVTNIIQGSTQTLILPCLANGATLPSNICSNCSPSTTATTEGTTTAATTASTTSSTEATTTPMGPPGEETIVSMGPSNEPITDATPATEATTTATTTPEGPPS